MSQPEAPSVPLELLTSDQAVRLEVVSLLINAPRVYGHTGSSVSGMMDGQLLQVADAVTSFVLHGTAAEAEAKLLEAQGDVTA